MEVNIWHLTSSSVCWMCFELEENFEFSSYLSLSLVSHWIGDGRLGSIYTNSPMLIVMNVGPWATSSHARTHAELGQVRVARTRDLRTRMQFDSRAC